MTKLSRITLVFLTALFICPSYLFEIQSCRQIDETFSNATVDDEQVPCRCYYDHLETAADTLENDKIWIGCTQQNLPIVFRTLNSVNETFLSKLVIWNSLINILPGDMFAKVRPRELSIESSMLSVFRPGAFDNIGNRLKKLNLRNNIIKHVDSFLFQKITALEDLDISKNKIATIEKDTFAPLSELKSLLLEGNQIANIEDESFGNSSGLTVLNLANNKLRQIKKDTFKNLVNLEVLNLAGNQITTVDWSAFSHMKKLRILNLGKNGLSKVEIRGLPKLQHLFLNNNQIESLKDIVLRDLPGLTTMSLDRNGITVIANDDFVGLGQSSRLSTITLTANHLEDIESRAFDPIHGITSLSLHSNSLTSFHGKKDNVSYLASLKKLEYLDISANRIKELNDGDLSVLTSLQEIILDHNQIERVTKDAFAGLHDITKLFLNNNNLYFLPEGIFDHLNIEKLSMIDLSNNFWECVCGQEWLGPWLKSIGQANAASSALGCLEEECIKTNAGGYHPSWVTAVAFCLFLVTVCCIVSIGYLVIQECRKNWPNNKRPLASDKERLISESLSFPNPVNLPEINQEEQRVPETTPKKDSASTADKKHVRFS